MDFITKLTPIQESSSVEKLAEIYIKEVVARYRVLVFMVLHHNVCSTSRLWRKFHEEFGTQLLFKNAYHSHTYGQSERSIQTLKDMFRARVLSFIGNWDTYLLLVEFSYNNSYHANIGMPPFEMLYGRKCQTSIC